MLRKVALKGTYTLLLACDTPFNVRIGAAGTARIELGHYLYTGSALGQGSTALERRIKRHRDRMKPVKWHVDCLTVRREITIKAAICLESKNRMECSINRNIILTLDAEPVLPKAGSTDCKCSAHLLSVRRLNDEREILRKLEHVYSKAGKPFYL